MKKVILSILVGFTFAGVVAIAEEVCEVTTDRTACPGKNDEALKPYDMKNPTVEPKKKIKSKEECSKYLDENYKISRRVILSKKVTTVKWDGKELATKTDTSDCK